MTSEPKSYRQIFREFAGHLTARRQKQIALLFLLMLVGSVSEILAIGAVVPFISLMARPEMAAEYPLLQNLFSLFGWRQADSLVLPMSIAFVTLVLIATGIRLLLVYATNRLVFALGHDVGVKVYSVALHQPYSYHIAQNTSEIIADVNRVQLLVNAFLRPAMEGATAVILSIAILVALLLVDAVTALAAGLIFAIVYLVIIRLFRARLRANSKIISDAQGTRIRCVQEGLGGIRDVILDANQGHYVGQFSKVDQRFRQAQAKNAFLGQAPRFLVEAIGVTLIVALAYALSLKTGGLIAALPTLAALALGAQRLLPLVQKMYGAWAQFSGNFHVFQDVLLALGLPVVDARQNGEGTAGFEKAIEFNRLGFRYQPDGPDVLRAIDLKIDKGSRVGIVGRTGSGKSTLLDVLMGLLDPTSGTIRIDGVSLKAFGHCRWQERIAHVPQHIYLSDASIAENIALGVSPNQIDFNRVRRAARQAQIAEFIEASRQGYDTRVGERGVQLSGGQRQRIGIARALYKDADVLVFDEASSALDMETETAVMEAVAALDSDLTLFIIAHRVQTLRGCDLIVRLDEGEVVEAGSYEMVIQDNHDAQVANSAN
mgnify:CR=1 FL=1